MTGEELVARTARRKAEGANQVYHRHANRVSAPAIARLPLPVIPPCAHEGAVIEPCTTCKGEPWHVRACALWKKVTHEPRGSALMNCQKCRAEGLGYAPRLAPAVYPDVATRHLLYHVYPRRRSRWRERVRRLRARIDLFNGTRAVAVVEDGSTDPAREVAAELPDCEVFAVPNDPALREVVTFLPLFERISQFTDPTHAVLYAHAKGVTRPPDATCHRWVEVMEDVMLGKWDVVSDVLNRYPVAGCFKKVGRGWPAHESKSAWHYSGSYFWTRTAELLKRDWRTIDNFWGGIEPYPSLHFSAAEAGVVFHEAPVPRMNLYNPAYWNGTVEPAFAQWCRQRAGARR